MLNGALLALIHIGWLGATWYHDVLPAWILFPLGGTLLAWHSSFQHEAIHGHVATPRWLNELPAWPPLSLWLPFPIYRDSHRAHHNFDILTDPYLDPESFYVDRRRWSELPRLAQSALIWHNTLPGRLLLGPFLTIGQFFFGEGQAFIRGDRRHLSAWLWHAFGITIVLVWVIGICSMPFWHYLLFFVFPGASLTLLRSFAEHKAAHTPFERTAIVEAGGFFSALFLNNNLHFAHHCRPDLPWRDLPAYYRDNKEALLEQNGQLYYPHGYREIAGKFSFQPVDKPAHPLI